MRKVAVDTNLLLLLLIGSVAPDFIEKHKRLRAYTLADFRILEEDLQSADSLMATPNILTELSNLAAYGVSEPLRTKILEAMRIVISGMQESYQMSSRVVDLPEFNRLGLSDCAWFGALDLETELLTDDLALYLAALRRGFRARNFTHLREAAAPL
jgi:hypothetical protein